MPITLQELARQLNLSKGTISRVLNNREDAFISEATRQRVQEAARELGYRPNRAARALATGRSHSIAFCTNKVTALSSLVLNRVQGLVQQHDLELIIQTFDRQINMQGEQTISSPWHVDGVLTYESSDYIHLIFDDPTGIRPPTVNMGTYLIEDTDFVGTDLCPAIVDSVQHLLSVGCRRIAYMEEEEAAVRVTPDFRHLSYQDAMEAAGGRPEYIITPDGARASARKTIQEYAQARDYPDGILCRNDDLAIGTYRGLRDLGLRIPEDVALVGCDGIEDTEYLDPPLSTIVQPLEAMCDLAWEYLERRMRDPSRPLQCAVLPSQLVIRGSSQR